MKSASIDWSSFLIALALAFAIALSPLAHWAYGALGLPADSFIAFFVAFVPIWLMLRARRRWHQLPELQSQGGAARFMAGQLARTLVFAAIVCGGIALFTFALGDWLRRGGIWELLVTELLIFGALFKAASWASDVVGDPIWRNARVEKTRVPDGAALMALPAPFVVGRADGRFATAILAALGAVFLLAYAAIFIAARGAETATPAPTWAFVGAGVLLFALHCWWEYAPLGEVSASQIRPRFGRAFCWWDVATIEETRANLFMESDEMRLIFRDAKGAVLWQFPLDNLELRDKRELWRLLPEAAKLESETANHQSHARELSR